MKIRVRTASADLPQPHFQHAVIQKVRGQGFKGLGVWIVSMMLVIDRIRATQRQRRVWLQALMIGFKPKLLILIRFIGSDQSNRSWSELLVNCVSAAAGARRTGCGGAGEAQLEDTPWWESVPQTGAAGKRENAPCWLSKDGALSRFQRRRLKLSSNLLFFKNGK